MPQLNLTRRSSSKTEFSSGIIWVQGMGVWLLKNDTIVFFVVQNPLVVREHRAPDERESKKPSRGLFDLTGSPPDERENKAPTMDCYDLLHGFLQWLWWMTAGWGFQRSQSCKTSSQDRPLNVRALTMSYRGRVFGDWRLRARRGQSITYAT